MSEETQIDMTKHEAILKLVELGRTDELWRAGELSWKLKGKQIDIYNHFKDNELDIIPCLISRQFGKSYTMCALSVEICIRKPNAIVKYVCPTSKMVLNVMVPRVRDVIEDCPEDIKPVWYPSEKKWKFPNGSEIQVAGTESGAYDSIRGGSADLCIVDEAAFCSELESVIFNVLAPTTDTTGGKIYLATTPNPDEPTHDFHELFIKPYEGTGKLLKMTWLESPMVDSKRRAKIVARYPGGEHNIKFRCEYLCEVQDTAETTVIPEFSAVQDKVVKDVEVTPYSDFYVSMDLGFKDLTVSLFGFYDFKNGRLVIQDEYVVNGPDLKTDTLMTEIRKKEAIHFIEDKQQQDAYMRVMDNNNLMLTSEMSQKGLLFVPTAKHNKDQQIDKVRRWIEQERIIISPRCKNLIYHIKNAQWAKTRAGTLTGKFKHLKGNDSVGLLTSHADALDALIYMVRNIHTYRNPYPENYGLNITKDTYISEKHKKNNVSEGVDFMRNLFNLKKKR